MAKKVTRKEAKKPLWRYPFTSKNFIFFAIALGVIAMGYILMATGITEKPALPQGKWNNPFAVIIAPILLVVGYFVLIPYAIVKYFGHSKTEE